uniref:Uncharacterized protein n=1 Tax=Fagus sylvatica TaxID=28930 RepID=A0A2N9F198_FAGSY
MQHGACVEQLHLAPRSLMLSPESRAVRLFSTFRMVFPSFSARIPVSSNKLLTNRKNLVVDEDFPLQKGASFSGNSWLQNKGNWRDFLVGSLFFGVDSGQLGDAFDEPKEPASRGITVWDFRKVMAITALENVGCHYFGRREGCHNLRKHEGYHYIGRREGYHVFGKVRGITSLGDVGVSRLWESVWYHCLGRHEGYHSLGKVRGRF